MSASQIPTIGRSAGTIRLRITRRGRVVLGVLVALLVAGLVAAAAMLGTSRAVAADEAGAAQFGYVVVQPGESLWSVATSLDAAADPRDVIAELMRLNQLGSSEIVAGQSLAVPLRYTDAPGVVVAAPSEGVA